MKNIQSILIVILVGIILFMQMCNKPIIPDSNIEYRDSIIYVTDTIRYETIRYDTKTITKIETKIDTIEIINDYYSKYFYLDSIKIDTVGYIFIADSIYKNNIQYREVLTSLKVPSKIVTKEVLTYSKQFYVGLGIEGNFDGLNSISGNLLFVTKKQKAFSIGVGINPELEPILTGRIFWNLKR